MKASTNTGTSTKKKNIILLLITLALIITPLVFKSGAEFAGADDQAEGAITEINPGYKPWFESIWEPPSGEIESLLFCAQGAIGAGVIGYTLGYFKGKKKSASDR
ncbi:energy-coupling factor ABC transporter substrate-binding protein [Haloimpatiens massiliensis]|uniref:energy-coupling factor ABC transporter substrate-binding protein n=1 Tax=Haloimpatiens massiliensis TaxID=1658110 RepID=UPI000C8644C4|nr:energy-coupling factor ABC transporter substrate-binding protein [Haloimpatiens massiliensis]